MWSQKIRNWPMSHQRQQLTWSPFSSRSDLTRGVQSALVSPNSSFPRKISIPMQLGLLIRLGQGCWLTPQSVCGSTPTVNSVSVKSWSRNWPNVITKWVKFASTISLRNAFLLICLAFGRGSGPNSCKVENPRGSKPGCSYAEGTKRRCGVKVAPVVMLQRLLHVPSNVRYLPCLRHSNLLPSETSQFGRLSVSNSSWVEEYTDAWGVSYQPMKSSIPKRKLR